MSNLFIFILIFLSFLCFILLTIVYLLQTYNYVQFNPHGFERKNEFKNISIFLNGWSSYFSDIHNDLLHVLNLSNILNESPNLFLYTNYNFISNSFSNIGFETIKISPNLTEFDIEDGILEFCRNNENYNQSVLYIHLKGSFHSSFRNTALRKMSYYYLILNYKDCIEKLNNGADVCGTRYSIVPNRHYSGNMWWSKCSYIKALKPVRTMYNERKRYTIGTIGMKNDRYLAERWICSNNEVKACDLMDSDINYVYGYGNKSIYNRWITKTNKDMLLAPNLKTLCHSINYLIEESQPKMSFFVYVNYLFDIETFHHNTNGSSNNGIYNIGWCNAVLNISKNEIENMKNNNNTLCSKDDLYQILVLQDFCLLNKYMNVKPYYSLSNSYDYNINKDDESNVDVSVFFSECNVDNNSFISIKKEMVKYYKNVKYYCFNDNTNNNAENNVIYPISLFQNTNRNMEIISFIYNYCNSNYSSKYMFFIEDGYTAIDILKKYYKCLTLISVEKPICGVFDILPFRSFENNTWFALSTYISTLNYNRIYDYNGPKLSNVMNYGINDNSYRRWISINPFVDFFYFQSKLENVSDSVLASTYLIQTVFDIKSGILNISQFHYCYSFCSHVYYKFGLYFCYACDRIQKRKKSFINYVFNFLNHLI